MYKYGSSTLLLLVKGQDSSVGSKKWRWERSLDLKYF